MQTAKGFPLSLQQTRLWAMPDEKHAYRCQCGILLEGPLNREIFQNTCQQLVERHTILRSVFYTLPNMDAPMQVINNDARFTYIEKDLADLAAPSQAAQVEDLYRHLWNEPFDRANGPLLRLWLLRLSAEQHLLLISLPSLCSDAATLQLLVMELSSLYTAQMRREDLVDKPLDYVDVSAWQDELLQEEDVEQHQRLWRSLDLSQLSNLRLPFELGEMPGSQSTPFELAQQEIVIEDALSAQLSVLSQQHQIAPEALLLACWQILLWRLTGEETSIVGVACQGRTYEELTRCLGLYTRLVPLSLSFEEDLPFLQVSYEVNRILEETIEEQYFFNWEDLLSSSTGQGGPIFPISFAYESWPAQILSGDISYRLKQHQSCQERLGLHLRALQVGAHLSLSLDYDTTRLSGLQVQQIARLYATLLSHALEQPQALAGRLPLLTGDQEHWLLRDWNRPLTPEPDPRCLHTLFEEQVARTPDVIAVVSEETCLSYADLDERSNQLAHYLRQRGVGTETMVGVLVERSAALLICMFAVMKAGGGYVPLDPAYPPERLALMLADAQVGLVLTLRSHSLASQDISPVYLEQDWSAIVRQPREAPLNKVQGSNVAYVIYTSGSTGTPKGVVVSHNGVGNLGLVQGKVFGMKVGDHILQFSSLSFDASIWETLVSLLTGATLDVVAQARLWPGPDLLAVLRERAITMLLMPPSALAQLPYEPLPSLTTMIIGGEACTAELVRRWAPNRHFWHGYGPTEMTVCASVMECHSQEAAPPIGRPITNTRFYVLDKYWQLVPSGIAGELYIEGVGLARGYLRQAAMTAERFIPHPFSEVAGARLYRTGDRARLREDGQVEYLGRFDNQVKVRGYRVELEEIEAVLNQHQAIQESVVLAREDIPGHTQLVAYIATRPGVTMRADEARIYLSAKLPEYMLPSHFVLLEALPLTPNGKLDRRGLPAPNTVARKTDESVIAPQGPIEELIADCWREVLRVQEVGVYDNFFAAGGHSLLATQLVSRVRARTQCELSLGAFFANPTVAELAEQVKKAESAEQAMAAPPMPGTHTGSFPLSLQTEDAAPLVPVVRTGTLPLSFAQQRLWFLNQLDPNSCTYNVPLAVRLAGTLDVKILERSFGEIIRRHEILRTTFSEQDGQPIQVIHPAGRFQMQKSDLSELAAEESEAEVRRLADEEALHPFDLLHGPLMRVVIVRLNRNQHILLLSMHHIITDGWSLGVLVQEVAELYKAFVEGRHAALPSLPIQYADYASWQRDWFQGPVREEQLSYWKKQLEGVPILELPTDYPRPLVQSYRGASRSFELSRELSKGLTSLSRHEGVTLFMTLLAAFQILLARYSRQNDIVVGTPIANRRYAQTEALIGMFVNTLILRGKIQEKSSFKKLLEQMREVTLGAYAHQDLPFEQLVEELQQERDPTRNPLFQVLFVLQNAPMPALELRGVRLSPIEVDNGTARLDLTLILQEDGDRLTGTINYNTDLFKAETIDRLAKHYRRLLEGILQDAKHRIADLAILSEAEQEQLLITWNATSQPYHKTLCLHELIARQARYTPDIAAIVFEDRWITYEQLDRCANQLANYLQSIGVKPEICVGVCLERSIELIIALLGILKAGGAYVPLDPSYPVERLTFMIQETEMLVLLTQEKLREHLPAQGVRIIALEDERARIEQESVQAPMSEEASDHLAYVIYTSGSTGRPKGVSVAHRGLYNIVQAHKQIYASVLPGSRVLQFFSSSFDASVFEITMALCRGATLCLTPPHMLGTDLLALLEHQAVTAITLPPSVLATLPPARLAALKVLTVAGDACSSELVEIWGRDRQFFNAYGPTETTIWATIAECSPDRTKPSIGHPIVNTQVYVLDLYGQPVPIGVPGELYIGGIGLARGYLKRADLTAASFVPHPFGLQPGERLYRTGDLVRYQVDGSLEFLGRIDQQVKLRGYRIELGEIETALIQHTNVRECVVMLRDDVAGEPDLIAYIVAKKQPAPLNMELRRYLHEHLPAYMLPSAFVFMQALPLTANGKVDRHALSMPQREKSVKARSSPGNSTEIQLLGIWEEILGQPSIGVTDNFFELGGHSILAVQLMTQIRLRLGQDLALSLLFQYPTIAELAGLLDRQRDPECWSALVAIRLEGAKAPFFCVHPAGGTVFCYYALAQHLNADRPFYGLQAPDLDGEGTTYSNLPEMAAQYITAIQSIQPQGPYLLGGWSLGGMIAFEIAQQLQRQGQQIAILALFDSHIPQSHLSREFDASDSALARFLVERYGVIIPEEFSERDPQEQLAYILVQGKAANKIPEDTELMQFRRFGRMQFMHTYAVSTYVPEMYPGRITLFRASQTQETREAHVLPLFTDYLRTESLPVIRESGVNSLKSNAYGWHNIAAQGVEVHIVQGTHTDLLDEPNVGDLANALRHCLARVDL